MSLFLFFLSCKNMLILKSKKIKCLIRILKILFSQNFSMDAFNHHFLRVFIVFASSAYENVSLFLKYLTINFKLFALTENHTLKC